MFHQPDVLRARIGQLDRADWQPLFDYQVQLRAEEIQGIDRQFDGFTNQRIRQLKLMMDRMRFWVKCTWHRWPKGEAIFRGDLKQLHREDPVELCKFLTALFQNQTSGGEALNIAFENGTVLRVVQALATHARKSRRR